MASRQANLLTWLSVLAFLGILMSIPITSGGIGEYWEYFAIYGQKPVLIDGCIEFGKLYPEGPFVAKGPSGYNGPFPYFGGSSGILKAWPRPPAISAQWRQVWQFGGIGETKGILIPPWGWRVAPAGGDGPRMFGQDPQSGIPFVKFRIPLFYLAMMVALFPIIRLIRFVFRPRWKVGTCKGCGYDLRATPKRCPECGTAA